MQADAFAGFNELYEGRRKPVPIIEAACWSHWRRKFFDLAKLTKAPIAIEAVQKIDVLFEIERGINGFEPDMRVAARREQSKPLCDDLRAWLITKRDLVSVKSNQLRSVAMGNIHPLSERWTYLPLKQCGRTRSARHRARPRQLDIRGFGCRGP